MSHVAHSEILQPDDEDTDSALGEDMSTASQSVRSSIYDYHYENGRRYHAYGNSEYLLPNDEDEQSRLDLLHHIFKMVLHGELYTAPLDPSSLQRVLDVGTGTGIWAIELADQFPAATVIGTDISPIQPLWVPPNCHFYIDDAETPWSFEEPFDLIHGRALCGGIADWPEFYRQAYLNLKPGGWMEMQDHECWLNSDDDTINEAPWCREWIQNVEIASTNIGKRLNVAHLHYQWMVDAGFVDVEQQVHKIPIGSWPKDKKLKRIGAIWRHLLVEGLEGLSLKLFTEHLGYDYENLQALLAECRNDIKQKGVHAYLSFYVVFGQKPD